MKRFHSALYKIVEFYITAINLNWQKIAYSLWQFKLEGGIIGVIIKLGYWKSGIN